MQYKNFTGSVIYCNDLGIYVGEVLKSPHVMSYMAKTKEELFEAFCFTIEMHLLALKEHNILEEYA